MVVFADGSSSEKMLTDLASVAKAQAEAIQFNALAGSARPVVGAASGNPLAPPRTVRGLSPSWSAKPPCAPRACWTMRSTGQHAGGVVAGQGIAADKTGS